MFKNDTHAQIIVKNQLASKIEIAVKIRVEEIKRIVDKCSLINGSISIRL